MQEISRKKPILKNLTAPEIEQVFVEMATWQPSSAQCRSRSGSAKGTSCAGRSVSRLSGGYGTTPVVYFYLDRFRLWAQRQWHVRYLRLRGDNSEAAGE